MIFKITVVLLAIGIVFGIINFINIDQHYLGTVAYIALISFGSGFILLLFDKR